MGLSSVKSIEDIVKLIQIEGGMPSDAIASLTAKGVIFAILSVALCIFVAYATKKGRVICFFAAAMNFINLILVPKQIKNYHEMVMIKYVYGTSEEEVNGKIMDYYKESIPSMITSLLTSFVALLAFIFTIILICKIMSVKPKVFGVFALIIHIISYIAIGVVPFVPAFLGNGITVESQMSHATLYFVSRIIPLVLLAFASIFAIVRSAKAPKNVPEISEDAE